MLSSLFPTGVLALAILAGWAAAAPPATQQATQPATAKAGPDVALLELLGKLEARSAEVQSFQADVRLDLRQGLVGDRQLRLGRIVYLSGPPARFAAHFTKEFTNFDARTGQADERPLDQAFIFDGQWLVERSIAKEKDPATGGQREVKRLTKQQVVAPGADPAKADPLALGSGPFPLPLNMKKDLLLARFEVTRVDQDPKYDPKQPSLHLKLVPRAGERAGFTEAHFWYDAESLLPVKVRTFDKDSENEKIIEVRGPRLNQPVDDKAIDTAEPKDKGWSIQVTPWKG